jgi:hypothetical protein
MSKSIVRTKVEKIDGVSRTCFEWSLDRPRLKTLVVEVSFDTDPSAPGYRQDVLDEIADTVKRALAEETTMVVSSLKVVPARW